MLELYLVEMSNNRLELILKCDNFFTVRCSGDLCKVFSFLYCPWKSEIICFTRSNVTVGTDALFQIARMFEATSRTTSNAVGSVGFLFDFKSYLLKL